LDETRHPVHEFVRSADAPLPKADEYLIDAVPPTGALLKADNPKLVLDGKVRTTCGKLVHSPARPTVQGLGTKLKSTFTSVSSALN